MRGAFILCAVLAASAARADTPKELRFPEDGFAITAATAPEIRATEYKGADLRTYLFLPESGQMGAYYVLNVRKVSADDTRADEEILNAAISKRARDVTKVFQAGVAGLQYRQPDKFQEMVVRTFIRQRTVYSLRAFHVTAAGPEASDASWRECYDWLNSWRPLTAKEADAKERK